MDEAEMSTAQQSRAQPWKTWYAPLEKASNDLALAVLPVFLAGNGPINGAEQMGCVVYTATNPLAAQVLEAAAQANSNTNADQKQKE